MADEKYIDKIKKDGVEYDIRASNGGTKLYKHEIMSVSSGAPISLFSNLDLNSFIVITNSKTQFKLEERYGGKRFIGDGNCISFPNNLFYGDIDSQILSVYNSEGLLSINSSLNEISDVVTEL